MGHEWVLWILVTASAMHVVEEHALGWQGWATGYIGGRVGALPTWTDFWATNALMIVYGIAAAAVGWSAPAFALSFPAVLLIDAVFFHFLPSARARRANPGFFTALLLYVPIGLWAYVAASDDGMLSAGTLILSLAIGVVAMAFAVGSVAMQRLGYPDATELPEPTAAEEPAAPGL